MTTIRRIVFDDARCDPEFQKLVDEYAEESSIAGMPEKNVDDAAYRSMEQLGMLHAFAAYDDEKLVGFISVLVAPIPHYSAKIGSTESFFVAKEYRKTGLGLRLLRIAEKAAKESGAVGFFVSAPYGGRLADVMPRIAGYSETNRVFFRSLS